jgi:proton-dependent oligopeptide transporter, POT family
MFSKHPNGLIAAALANMGERFGFYIMMAIHGAKKPPMLMNM